jgi:hypothetical protein
MSVQTIVVFMAGVFTVPACVTKVIMVLIVPIHPAPVIIVITILKLWNKFVHIVVRLGILGWMKINTGV